MRLGSTYSFRHIPFGIVALLSPTLCSPSFAASAVHAVLVPSVTPGVLPFDFSDCVPYTGPLNAVSVPVNGSVNLFIHLAEPPSTDLVFQLAAANPAYVAAGDKVQGFLPQVTVPAGQVNSNTF